MASKHNPSGTESSLAILQHTYCEGRSPMSRRPFETHEGNPIPNRCLLSFMRDALEEYVSINDCKPIALHHSEACDYTLYETEVQGTRIGVMQAPVGAPAAAMVADRLIYSGVKAIASCGGCGVLKPISSGKILIPTKAVRDEGTSFHYVEPSFDIELSLRGVNAARETMTENDIPHELCTTWTTDGFFRETPSIVKLRKKQGCSTVDMECSALAAVAKCYGIDFFSVLYSGDSLDDPNNHDARNWMKNISARTACFELALLSLVRMDMSFCSN